MAGRSRGAFEGWPLVGWTALGVGALVAGMVATSGLGEASLRAIVRATARIAVVLFSLAFAASSLRKLWRNAATAWIRRNRRQLGVSFAVAQTFHLAAIIALCVELTPRVFFASVGTFFLAGGSLGFAFTYAMAATSFDRSAAWLGPRRWKLLHTVGGYDLAAIFAFTYAPAPFVHGLTYLPFALISVGVLVLRALTGISRAASADTSG
jgi:hypothetical protein